MDQDTRHPAAAGSRQRDDAGQRHLPDGWQAIGRCRQALTGATGCLVLAHPQVGIALVDVAPGLTPNAEGRLRRLLAGGAGLDQAAADSLPIAHLRIETAEWGRLPQRLAAAFASLSPPMEDGSAGWIASVREALAGDPAWMATEARHRGAEPWPSFGLGGRTRRGRAPREEAGRRRGAEWVVGVLIFVAGVVSGRILAPPGSADAPGVLAWTATPGGTHSPFEAVAPLPELPPRAEAIEPDPPAAVPPPEIVALAPDPPAPAPEPVSAGQPPPPVAEPPPLPPRRVASRPAAPSIDRRCADAMFRWQQGSWIDWSERAYLRQGCAGRTR